MITYTLHLIRHGVTQWGASRRYLGQSDQPLCSEGIAAAKAKTALHGYPSVEAVYSCPLKRCRETAGLIYPEHHLTVVEDLIEMSMGDFEGFTFDELKNDPAFEAWMNDSANCPPPGGESSIAFGGRISDGLHAVFMNMQSERVRQAACVLSGGVMMSLLGRHTYSNQPLSVFASAPLEGYSISLSTQLWASHRIVEVKGKIPLAE